MLIKFGPPFKGMYPRIDPYQIPQGGGVTVSNFKLWGGDLNPFNTNQFVVTPAKAGTKQTIYRFGQDNTNEAQYWFHSTSVVDYVRGPINDVNERTYFTGEGEPRVTDATLALGVSALYPTGYYTLGIPKPTGTPTATVSGTGTGVTETRRYAVTYVSGWSEEGILSNLSLSVNVQAGQTVTVGNLPPAPSGAYNITQVRIYRSNVGDSGANWQLVTSVAVGTTSFADTVLSADLGVVCESEEYDMPPSDLHSIAMLANGCMAGLSGNLVCFTPPNRPHAWPLSYRYEMSFKGVALASFGNTIVVGTNGHAYRASATDPRNVSLEKILPAQACVSKRSMTSFGTFVAYASPDGLVVVGGGLTKVSTTPFMTRDDWQAYKPSSILGAVWDGRYVGFYDTGTVQGGFIVDLDNETPSFSKISTFATAAYVDPQRDSLYLQVGNDIVRFDGGATKQTGTFTSGIVRLPKPDTMGVAQVFATTYPLTFKVYADGVLKYTKTVNDRNEFRLPSGFLASDWQVEVSGAVRVNRIEVATSPRELAKS